MSHWNHGRLEVAHLCELTLSEWLVAVGGTDGKKQITEIIPRFSLPVTKKKPEVTDKRLSDLSENSRIRRFVFG